LEANPYKLGAPKRDKLGAENPLENRKGGAKPLKCSKVLRFRSRKQFKNNILDRETAEIGSEKTEIGSETAEIGR
jgi:hypothetical protein